VREEGFVSVTKANPKAWMSWSSGKDSAMALHVVRSSGDVEVTALLSTVNAAADRVAMHAVRRSLLEAQANRLGLPVVVVEIPSPCPNEVYEARMGDAMTVALGEGVEHVVFGDLFLADVREYRESRLAGTGISPLFPLWGRPTGALAREMIGSGLQAVLTCVDPAQLCGDFVGRRFDAELVADLPAGVDPCGEHGEFHTFAWDAPGFRAPVNVQVGEVVERDGFVFCDLVAR
jgi:uncharacterized protein (TIGR00290 family)